MFFILAIEAGKTSRSCWSFQRRWHCLPRDSWSLLTILSGGLVLSTPFMASTISTLSGKNFSLFDFYNFLLCLSLCTHWPLYTPLRSKLWFDLLYKNFFLSLSSTELLILYAHNLSILYFLIYTLKNSSSLYTVLDTHCSLKEIGVFMNLLILLLKLFIPVVQHYLFLSC